MQNIALIFQNAKDSSNDDLSCVNVDQYHRPLYYHNNYHIHCHEDLEPGSKVTILNIGWHILFLSLIHSA